MSVLQRPEAPAILTRRTAEKYIRDLTRWMGPGFHPEEDFRNYVTPSGANSFTEDEAKSLNDDLELVGGYLECHGVDPARIASPVQRKALLRLIHGIPD